MTLSLSNKPKFSTLLELPLMSSPHHEDDAQKWFVVHVNDFLPNSFHSDKLTTLRIVLSQPSGLWKKSTLEQIDCYEEMDASSTSPSVTSTVTTDSFTSPSIYTVESAESGFYKTPSVAMTSLLDRTTILKAMIEKLRNCKRSKLGNPGSTLDFGGGAATLVKIRTDINDNR